MPDLCAFAGFPTQGPRSLVSIRLNAFSEMVGAFVGLEGLPRRIGAMASNTFSRACTPLGGGDDTFESLFRLASERAGRSGGFRGERGCCGGGFC